MGMMMPGSGGYPNYMTPPPPMGMPSYQMGPQPGFAPQPAYPMPPSYGPQAFPAPDRFQMTPPAAPMPYPQPGFNNGAPGPMPFSPQQPQQGPSGFGPPGGPQAASPFGTPQGPGGNAASAPAGGAPGGDMDLDKLLQQLMANAPAEAGGPQAMPQPGMAAPAARPAVGGSGAQFIQMPDGSIHQVGGGSVSNLKATLTSPKVLLGAAAAAVLGLVAYKMFHKGELTVTALQRAKEQTETMLDNHEGMVGRLRDLIGGGADDAAAQVKTLADDTLAKARELPAQLREEVADNQPFSQAAHAIAEKYQALFKAAEAAIPGRDANVINEAAQDGKTALEKLLGFLSDTPTGRAQAAAEAGARAASAN